MLKRRTDQQARAAQHQRIYYQATADCYDIAHVGVEPEHDFAQAFLVGAFQFLDVRTVLDVGAGTGRTIEHIRRNAPGVTILGIEPVAELRRIGHAKGIPTESLVSGFGHKLDFPDNSFDIVCAFGVLHHTPQHSEVVAEMIRVARVGVFISDANNFGQGSAASRVFKQLANAIGAWPLVNFAKTKGKGYHVSDGDGVFYSYSVYDDYEMIRSACAVVHVVNTRDGGKNPARSASHVALLGILNRI